MTGNSKIKSYHQEVLRYTAEWPTAHHLAFQKPHLLCPKNVPSDHSARMHSEFVQFRQIVPVNIIYS